METSLRNHQEKCLWVQSYYGLSNDYQCKFSFIHHLLLLIPGGGTRPENWWGCAAGRWKLDPKRSRKKLNLWPKRSIFVKIGSFCTPKDSFAVGGWEKVPQKDRARSCQSEKRGSKPRHICITHHIGSTPPGLLIMSFSFFKKNLPVITEVLFWWDVP